MSKTSLFRMVSRSVFVIILSASAASATAGLAEWSIQTPGGNEIDASDRLHGKFGIALIAGIAVDPPQVLVPNLKRWKYYQGFIAGESSAGFFLMNEKTHQLFRMKTEPLLTQKLNELGLNVSLSGWLNGEDGYQEAWFPLLVWPPCALKLGLLRESEFPNDLRTVYLRSPPLIPIECTSSAIEARLQLYRQTRWGSDCQRLKIEGIHETRDPRHIPLHRFCERILKETFELKYEQNKAMNPTADVEATEEVR